MTRWKNLWEAAIVAIKVSVEKSLLMNCQRLMQGWTFNQFVANWRTPENFSHPSASHLGSNSSLKYASSNLIPQASHQFSWWIVLSFRVYSLILRVKRTFKPRLCISEVVSSQDKTTKIILKVETSIEFLKAWPSRVLSNLRCVYLQS